MLRLMQVFVKAKVRSCKKLCRVHDLTCVHAEVLHNVVNRLEH